MAKSLWHVLETDTSPPIRLIALRRLIESQGSAVVPRLTALVAREGFPQRPMWEKSRTVGALARIGSRATEELFESWIPSKWLWQSKDFDATELEAGDVIAIQTPTGGGYGKAG